MALNLGSTSQSHSSSLVHLQWEEFDFANEQQGGKKINKTSSTRLSASAGIAVTPPSATTTMKKGAAVATSGGRGSWEDMRKEARQLENQIDVKLVSFTKLGANFSSSSSSALGPASSSDKAPLLESPNHAFESVSSEIAGLLSRLAVVNEGMAEYAAGQPQTAAVHHTLQRHRDILQDYRQEFGKTKSNIESMIEREDLLSSVHREINDYGRGTSRSGSSKRMDLLLKESESARNSERMIDDHINIAIEARDALASQRATFKAIQTKLNDISNRFPMINSLVQKINLRKRRDTVILGLVVGLCFTFLLWYAFG